MDGVPGLRFRQLVRRLSHAAALPRGARFAHLTEPLYRRIPAPFLVYTARRLGLPARPLLAAFDEARTGPLASHLARVGALANATGYIGPVPGATLYALVRVLQPEVVVETGVASGMSSAFILAAMDANAHGRLVSIDLPFREAAGEPEPIVPGTSISKEMWSPVPVGREHGWLVPDELRGRWDLRVGDARNLLPPTLAELGEIDVFLHDSLHTMEHMLFEFEEAWPRIRPGGLLASDDLGRVETDPLQRFARRIGSPLAVIGGMGFVRRPT